MKAIFFDLGDTLVDAATRKFLPGAKDLLAQCSTKGLRIGVISNTGTLTRAQLTALLPPDFNWTIFEPALVVLSSEVGIEKPNPKIFELAISKAGIAAGECLYCSENLLETLAAQQAGMRAARLSITATGQVDGLVDALLKAGLIH